MKKLVLSILAIAFLNGCESVDYTQNSYTPASYSSPIDKNTTQSQDESYFKVEIDDDGKYGDIGTQEYTFKLILSSGKYKEGKLTILARTRNGVFVVYLIELQQVKLGLGGNDTWPSFEAIKVGNETFYIVGQTDYHISEIGGSNGTFVKANIESPQLKKMFLNAICSSSCDGKIILVGENESVQLSLSKKYLSNLIEVNSKYKIDTSLNRKTPVDTHRLKTANRRKYKHGNKFEIDNIYDKLLDFIESGSDKKWTSLRYEKYVDENFFGKDILITGRFSDVKKDGDIYKVSIKKDGANIYRYRGVSNVLLQDGKLSSVRCSFYFPSSSEAFLLSLEKGEEVHIYGQLTNFVKKPETITDYGHYLLTIENCLFTTKPQ